MVEDEDSIREEAASLGSMTSPEVQDSNEIENAWSSPLGLDSKAIQHSKDFQKMKR